MAKNLARLTLGIVVLATLTGCGSTSEELPVATTPPGAVETATPTPTSEPERGSRANPLAVGEYRALSAESMWTVGAEAPTVVNDGYVVIPLRFGIDWEICRQIAAEEGVDVDTEGVELYESLLVSYVGASGRSYTTMDDLSIEIEIPNDFYLVGTLYPPVDAVSASVVVSVPADEVPGGMWSVEELLGNVVFIEGVSAAADDTPLAR